MAGRRVVVVTKEGCGACEYVKSHVAGAPGLGDVVEFVDAMSPEGMAVLADHEMLEGAPMPFVEIDGEFYSEGYKLVERDGKEILVPIRSKIVKKIKELCAECTGGGGGKG